jgi:hypothetical protein
MVILPPYLFKSVVINITQYSDDTIIQINIDSYFLYFILMTQAELRHYLIDNPNFTVI